VRSSRTRLDVHGSDFSPDGAALAPGAQGALNQIIDFDAADPTDGDNLLELMTQDVSRSYPPVIVNVDLLVELH
jgi:hypothetical protein